ncbi:hypothetical protein SEA_SUCHA_54 [Microbacterium phage Sucha]|nr:hypothetical protein SEA_SUCHA_54 [Microbacterium phage Sucha]
MIRATGKDLALAEYNRRGDYDTDRGGRNPLRREEIRDDAYRLAYLASMGEEDWNLLPLHDLVLIQRFAAIISANAAEKTIVRLQQSGTESAFKRAVHK